MKIFFQAFENSFSKREKAALAQQGKADAEEVCAQKGCNHDNVRDVIGDRLKRDGDSR